MATVDDFEPGHQDRVTVLHVNFDGTRILTASADHRVKVWERSPQTGQRTLTETWTAHDADIRDVRIRISLFQIRRETNADISAWQAKWLHPTTGSHIVTIGNDLRLRLWAEDPMQAPNSGRRFKLLYQIHSNSRVPFVSLDLKNVDSVYTYLAVIDRQGLLSVYEPTNPDEFKEWLLVDQWHVCQPPPARGQETSFKVRFDQNPVTLPYINSLSDDKSMLSLVATAINEVKIYRSVTFESNGTLDSDSSSRQMAFVEAARLPVHPALIRDVQWAPFNVRGTDLIATACRDGSVRIYGLDILPVGDSNKSPGSGNHASSGQLASQVQAPRSAPQSSLTTAITGRNSNSTSSTSTPGLSRFAQQRSRVSLPFKHNISQVAELANVHKDVWALAWDPNGQVLMSNGSDGITKMWKQSVMNGAWMLFADQEISIESGDEAEEDVVTSKQERDGS